MNTRQQRKGLFSANTTENKLNKIRGKYMCVNYITITLYLTNQENLIKENKETVAQDIVLACIRLEAEKAYIRFEAEIIRFHEKACRWKVCSLLPDFSNRPA
jgi:hypothetical protein